MMMVKQDGLREALVNLLARDVRNTCPHEETYRGGAIWEICTYCGAKWADDEGGKPDWTDPPEWVAARAVLSDISPLANEALCRGRLGDSGMTCALPNGHDGTCAAKRHDPNDTGALREAAPELSSFIFGWFNERDCDEMRACLEEYDRLVSLSPDDGEV